jgi:gliding motility-associated lipoprotein GldD
MNTVLKCSLCFIFIFWGCEEAFVPKPRGYFKINFPQKEYVSFDRPDYPYSFEYPTYATVVKDSTFFGDPTENPWWINIDFPQFNGRIYVSYKTLTSQQQFIKVLQDAFKLTSKHTTKAYSIDDSLFRNNQGVSGLFFKVGGEVATANQFFLTDSTKHFLRGALYFDATPNEDSLSVVNRFLMEDMRHLIQTFRWKGN